MSNLEQSILTPTSAATATHAGHNHGGISEWLVSFLDHIPMDELLRTCISHIIIDAVNVFSLLIVIMFAVFLISGYFDIGRLQKKLHGLKSIWGFILAIFIGILSPFCSCSIIPVLMGFLSVGVPVSVCLCFLTASSMINITAIVSLYATTGVQFTTTYILASLFIIIVSSIIFSIFKLDSSVSSYHSHHHDEGTPLTDLKSRLKSAFFCTLNVLKRSALFILFGVILSSVIMTYLPIDTLADVVGENSALSVTLIGLIGIPIHSDIFSVAPLINLFLSLSKGLALTFTLATMAISLPSIILLSRAIKLKTVLCYCGVIIVLTLLCGNILSL